MRAYQVGDILRHRLTESYIEIVSYAGTNSYMVREYYSIGIILNASYDLLSQNWELVSGLEKELL